MHRPIFGHSFAVLVAPILLSVLAFNFLNKKKASARRNEEDADTGAPGSFTAPAKANAGGSSSSPTGNCYEVFLSFRGSDTRKGFTDHLYNGLLNAGIDTFRDDDELCQGQGIRPVLMEAIANSKVLIPIFSESYGTSSWCLDELVQIMERKNNNGQMVLPIFYKVKPSDVGHQIGRFGKLFHEREKRLLKRSSCDPTILKKWKKALLEVSTLSGYEADGYEADLVKSIVQKVLSELKKKFELDISENLVGIGRHVKEVMEFVDNKSHATLFVGIHGMGGIGKTTLAKAIYNELSNQFEHHSFIADIRESWKRNGAPYLQNKLINHILKRENEVDNEDAGTKFISSRFKGKKVLVLLDDVDDVVQVKRLAGNRDWFSSGSKIIITTRNEKILKEVGVDYAYEHKEMDNDQALILFSKHAFRRDFPPREFKDLTHEVVSIIGGLPLSLEVLGSLLCGEKLAFWRGTIDKLKKVPPTKVREKLMISYEALDYKQKQIFLDIACFFIGTDRRIASYMWDACGFFPEEGIEVLRFMSLIKIGYDHELRMHDQLRDLGREIVCEENQEQPENRSRLWDFEEVQKVLKLNKGTKNIKAINLREDNSEGSSEIAKRDRAIYTEEQFKNLTSLRFLHVEGAHLNGDFKDSVEELKWLRWPHCPANFEVKNFHARELVALELSDSQINERWQGWSSFKMAEKLKFLDLSFCESLETMDFLSAFKNLELLILNRCERLQQIDSSIGDMKALRRLELCGCHSLTELPAEIGKLKALEQLFLRSNRFLSVLPDSIGSLQNLEFLDISFSGIRELPNNIGRLRKLRVLGASFCINLKGKMPESMCNLSSLQRLDVWGCKELQSLPDLPSSLTYLGVTCQSRILPSLLHLTCLKELRVHDCESIEILDVSQLIHLRELFTDSGKNLLEVRGLDRLTYLESLTITFCNSRLDLPQFEHLKKLHVCDCENLVEMQGLDRLVFLEELSISQCASIERLELPNSGSLNQLDVSDCELLVEIQGLDRLEFLEALSVSKCASIQRLELPKSGSLNQLDVSDCELLVEIQGLDWLEFLEELSVSKCTSIERLDLPKSGSLKGLHVSDCKILVEIEGLDRLEFLEELSISQCASIESLPVLCCLDNLRTLTIDCWDKLQGIQSLERFPSCKSLWIGDCTSLAKLPNLSGFHNLQKLFLSNCHELREIPGLEESISLKFIAISRCSSLEILPDLSSCTCLISLIVQNCEQLTELRGLEKLEHLEELDISGCKSLKTISELPGTQLYQNYENDPSESFREFEF